MPVSDDRKLSEKIVWRGLVWVELADDFAQAGEFSGGV